MSNRKVGKYVLKGNEFDVMYRLYWYGPQEDGDLPSGVGMLNLMEKGLTERIKGEKRNQLTKKGYKAARAYYLKKNAFR